MSHLWDKPLVKTQTKLSEKKLRANRKNAKKSTGPRTTKGKSRASRNAIRHGLTSIVFGLNDHEDVITRIAKKLCEHDPFPYRYDLALEIAESQILLQRIRVARAEATEKQRAIKATEWLKYPAMLIVIEAELTKRCLTQKEIRPILTLMRRFKHHFKAIVKAVGGGQWLGSSPPPAPPLTEAEQQLVNFRHPLPELASLERYERRTLSRRRRAIRKFDALQD
jgi:hypothetical protein